MYRLLIFAVIFISSCKESCTEEFRSYSVVIKNFDGSLAELDTVLWISAVTSDTTILKPESKGTYMLMDDNSNIKSKTTFLLEAYIDGFLVASENYTFDSGECHVEKIEGRSTIVLD